MTSSQRRRLGLAIIIYSLLWLTVMPGVLAQPTLPEARDPYVNDYAEVITADDAAQLRTLLADLKTQTGVEATVLTIRAIADSQQAVSAVDTFAPRVFNAWWIGDKSKNNGVLILVAVADRQMRIQLGSGYPPADNQRMQQIIDGEMLPAFREGQYSTGIWRGALATARALGGDAFQMTAPTAAPTNIEAVSSLDSERVAPLLAQPTATNDGGSPVGLLAVGGGGIVAVVAGGVAWRRYQRYRPRRCPHCGTTMARLDDLADNAFLDAGQLREEVLGAVDYDVWRCATCSRHDIERYPTLLTLYKQCPRCGYQTVQTERQTLVAATEDTTGREQIKQSCQHCNFRHTQTVVLPKAQREAADVDDNSSSSSSSSSFGGGSTSGGGASGRW